MTIHSALASVTSAHTLKWWRKKSGEFADISKVCKSNGAEQNIINAWEASFLFCKLVYPLFTKFPWRLWIRQLCCVVRLGNIFFIDVGICILFEERCKMQCSDVCCEVNTCCDLTVSVKCYSCNSLLYCGHHTYSSVARCMVVLKTALLCKAMRSLLCLDLGSFSFLSTCRIIHSVFHKHTFQIDFWMYYSTLIHYIHSDTLTQWDSR